MLVEVYCRTDGCKSNGLKSVLVDPSPYVVCGYCSQEITDKTEMVDPPTI